MLHCDHISGLLGFYHNRLFCVRKLVGLPVFDAWFHVGTFLVTTHASARFAILSPGSNAFSGTFLWVTGCVSIPCRSLALQVDSWRPFAELGSVLVFFH